MAQPPSYDRQKNFADDFGNETDHSALNAELDRASNAINDIRKNLALIQADDGKIRASSITTDSLDQEVLDYVQAKALAGANAVADAATAIARDAEAKAEQAVGTAAGATETAGLAVEKSDRAMEASGRAVEKAEQALTEANQIDSRVDTAVTEALEGVDITGLNAVTIRNALGYTPYDGEANSKDFATTGEVAQAIAAIPEPVNADWEAESGAAQILNRPGDFEGATSGTAGKQGLVPAPAAGDQDKILTGSGEWKHASGVPVGFIGYYSAETPPAGYLKCDGAAVGRETYPELYAVIGTTFGEGDGSTTFNLPDLIGRFAEGSATPGTVKDAGLPNIVGKIGDFLRSGTGQSSAFGGSYLSGDPNWNISGNGGEHYSNIDFDASRSNPIYGNSDTVQPPALTLLSCIKAFDAAVNKGTMNIAGLAQEMANKADRISVPHLTMPSLGKGVDLTFSHGASYIAPDDGYILLNGHGSTYLLSLVSYAKTGYTSCISTSGGRTSPDEGAGCFIPVSKGQKFDAYYYQGKVVIFRFVYAEGSQP